MAMKSAISLCPCQCASAGSRVRLLLLTTLAIAFALADCALAFSQSPRLERIIRAGGQKGTEFTIQCQGEFLNDAKDILFYRAGLNLKALTTVDSTRIDVLIESDSDCLLGEHPLRIITDRGVSEIRTIHIGPYPQVDEKESNNDIANAQAISMGTTVHGKIDEGDVDYFSVNLKQGQRLSAEIVAVRLGPYLFDARLAVSDSDGNEISSCDDTSLLNQDPIVSMIAPKDGQYFVHIREAAFGGDFDSMYQLHVGGHPRPTVAYPAGGNPGEKIELKMIGDATGSFFQSATLQQSTDSLFELFPADALGIAPSPVRIRVNELTNVFEEKKTESAGAATIAGVDPPFALNGILSEKGDVDAFQFTAKQGDRFDVQTFAAQIGSPVDSVVYIVDGNGREIVRNDDGTQHDSTLRFIAPADGQYTLFIHDHLRRGGDQYVYRIEFNDVQSALELAVPVVSFQRPQLGQAIQLGRGNRFATLIVARRKNFSGPIELSTGKLPDGVTATFQSIDAGSHVGYVVFEASPGAPVSSGLIDINGAAKANSKVINGSLKHEAALVFGPPRNTVYHAKTVDKLPLVVVDSQPFKIDVDAVSVPIVQDGQLNLKVRAERQPGFDEPISLTVPYLPPWFELPEGGVVIPRGESVIDLPLITNIDAEPRKWTIFVNGQSSIDGQAVFASTAPISIEVANPYLSIESKRATVEQGGSTEFECDIAWTKPVSGKVVARLHGLPKQVSANEIEILDNATEMRFKVDVGPEAPAAVHNTLYVEVTINESGTPVTHYLGRSGVLEILEAGKQSTSTKSRLEILREKSQVDK